METDGKWHGTDGELPSDDRIFLVQINILPWKIHVDGAEKAT